MVSAWHALPLARVEECLRTDRAGRFLEEATARLAQLGLNRIQEERPPNSLVTLLHQFQSSLVVILLLAGVVTVVTGEYVDAGVIAAVLILNASRASGAVRGPDEQQRHRGGLEEALGDRAQKDGIDTMLPMGRHRDQLCSLFDGRLGDLVSRPSRSHLGGDPIALGPQRLR
jgi:hypothetical protein